jgi:hypothetical protein
MQLRAFLYELGFGFDGVMRVMTVVSVSLGLLALGIARGMFGSDWLAALTARLVFFNGPTYHHQWFHYIHVYLLGALLRMGCLIRFRSSAGAGDLFWCGMFLGIAMSFRFYYVGFRMGHVIVTGRSRDRISVEIAGRGRAIRCDSSARGRGSPRSRTRTEEASGTAWTSAKTRGSRRRSEPSCAVGSRIVFSTAIRSPTSAGDPIASIRAEDW